MAKAVANRDKDRDFSVALLVHGYVEAEMAILMVDKMPIDTAAKGRLRARVKRWVGIAQAQAIAKD